jgi:AcrR family transcriptional regulator
MATWRGRLAEPESTKEARFLAVAGAVAALVERGGASKVSVSAVARRAGVSRPWIYKYFGPDPDALVAHATTLYARQFSDLGRSRAAPDPASWRANIAEGTRDGLRDAVAAPWCVTLYFRHRHAPDAVGAAIREVEAAYVDRFLAELPPVLRRDPAAARRFVEVFTSGRLGAFHRWLDPAVRAAWTEDAMVAEILRPLDAWAR